ncbi:hypothetical protein [Erythrobacter sp. YT30]|uniref:hypothetical protein n=1 Tax=Erythrobacter sp. YT30 TaxID=1735012 RepID=UPI0012E3E677|nr:hypothetical protein [Erythrobacter sp. YT30]
MRIASKFRNATLAGSACFTLAGCSAGAEGDTFAMPIAEARSKLSNVQSSYETGSQTRTMRASGVSPKGIPVKLPKTGAFSSSCHLVLEEVDANSTRITPDCGDTGATTTDVAAEFFEYEIAAHVRKILTGEEIDTDALGKKMAILAMKNASAMIKEGGQADQQWVEEQQEAAVQRARNTQDGWGDDTSSNDW